MPRRVAIRIAGVVYPGRQEAADAYAIAPSTVTLRVKSLDPKWTDWIYADPTYKQTHFHSAETRRRQSERKRGRVVSGETRSKLSIAQARPVLINGVRYDSMKQAAEVLGITKSKVFQRINSPNKVKWKDWNYA